MSTYTPISTQTLASAAASVTFSGIPQNYTDLVVVASIASADPTFNRGLRLQINGDTGSNYSGTLLSAETSPTSSRETNATFINTIEIPPGTNWGQIAFNFQNYSNTTTNKTVLFRGGTTSLVRTGVGLWRNTSAITSITLTTSGQDIRSGTTVTLYGIGAGSPKAFGGDIVTTDGTYWYHTFNTSGVFSPVTNLSCDYLVVAGGGAGGGYMGGGGAGGYKANSLFLNLGTNYTVTVGAGGAKATTQTTRGANGSNSVFSTVTSDGGGGGGANTLNIGGNGGSGGGGGGFTGGTATTSAGGTGISGQGNNGGVGRSDGASYTVGGGGGGAGAVGGDSSIIVGGAGGAGTASSITGSSVTRAGGGGGGTDASAGTAGAAGSGGGGAGSKQSTPAGDGTVNTGGGGGGGTGGGTGSPGNGGSGVVIVRYLV